MATLAVCSMPLLDANYSQNFKMRILKRSTAFPDYTAEAIYDLIGHDS